MASYELDCASCGGPSTAARKDAKNCHACAVLKILTYLRSRYKRPRECAACGGRFRPQSQKDLGLCAGCDQRKQLPTDEACLFCRATVTHLAVHRKVCVPCMKDVVRQSEIVALLAKQQAQRIEEFGHLRASAPNIRKVA